MTPKLRLVSEPIETRDVGWRFWLIALVGFATAIYFWPAVFGGP